MSPQLRRCLLISAALALALPSSPTVACLPPAPGSVQAKAGFDEGYKSGFEAGLWKSSPTIVLAEVVNVGTTDAFGQGNAAGPDGTDYSNAPEVTLKIVRWLRGSGTIDRVKLHYGWLTSCGPMGPVSAAQGQVGERFVLFSNDPGWASENVVSIGAREAITHESRQALQAAKGQSDN